MIPSARGAPTPHTDVSADEGTKHDRLGHNLVGLAFAAAPTHIWALVVVGGQGVTLGFLVAASAVAMGIRRIWKCDRRVVLLVGVLMWMGLLGLVRGVLSAEDAGGSGRAARHWALYSSCILTFLGFASIRFRWSEFRRILPGVGVAYAVVVAYAVYQAFARRHGWPFAYLGVTNPSVSTDEFAQGLQPGASQANDLIYVARASSFFIEPTNLGMYLGYGAAVAFSLIDRGDDDMRWGYFGLFLTAIGCAANQSLTAVFIVGTVCLMNVFRTLWVASVAKVAGIVAGSVAGVALLALMPGAGDALALRLAELSVENSSGRFAALPEVVEAIARNPLGGGLGEHIAVGNIQSGAMVLLVELGVIAAILPATWLVSVAIGWVQSMRRRGSADAAGSSCWVLSSSFLLVHLCIWVSSGILYEPLFWSMSGVGLAAARAAGRMRRT